MEVILIRHGEPDYRKARKYFKGIGHNYAELTLDGEKQAYERSKDPRLAGAELIISSPYTRSLQTAAIISREINLPIKIETNLHEWFPDMKFIHDYDIHQSYLEFIEHRGIVTDRRKYRWESYLDLQQRTREAILPYKEKYQKVIVVCHAMVMGAFTHIDDEIEYCGVRVINL